MKNLYPLNPVLVIDDEEHILKSCKNILKLSNINNVILCQDSREVITILKEHAVSLILLDLGMPYISGVDMLSIIKENSPQIPVIILTGMDDVSIAVKCIKMGAEDYLLKPISNDNLVNSILQSMDKIDIVKENRCLKDCLFSNTLKYSDAFAFIISRNPRMLSIFKYAEVVSNSPKPVLITGETGTGKELIAKSLYSLSHRKGEMVSVNVAGLDDLMFSDTLFGHKKGAFTGADSDREGLIKKAKGGTLFLDEIGDLSIVSQVKLLRLIQEKEYMALGCDLVQKSDVKIIASTCVDLEKNVEAGKFRKDLYYRLNFHHIAIPPLRERRDDLPLLLEHFVQKAAHDLNKKIKYIDEGVFMLLDDYDFSGNVRELESMVFNVVSQCQGDNLPFDLFAEVIEQRIPKNKKKDFLCLSSANIPTIKEAVTSLIDRALSETGGNQTQAAKLLGITQQALSKRLK